MVVDHVNGIIILWKADSPASGDRKEQCVSREEAKLHGCCVGWMDGGGGQSTTGKAVYLQEREETSIDPAGLILHSPGSSASKPILQFTFSMLVKSEKMIQPERSFCICRQKKLLHDSPD